MKEHIESQLSKATTSYMDDRASWTDLESTISNQLNDLRTTCLKQNQEMDLMVHEMAKLKGLLETQTIELNSYRDQNSIYLEKLTVNETEVGSLRRQVSSVVIFSMHKTT